MCSWPVQGDTTPITLIPISGAYNKGDGNHKNRDTLQYNLLGTRKGNRELPYTHTGAALSSVYYQLIRDTDEGLYLAAVVILEIKLRYEAAPGRLCIHPTSASGCWHSQHHQRDPKPQYRLVGTHMDLMQGSDG